MSVPTGSRLTLEDLIPLIDQADFSPRQKLDLRSAVRTVAKRLGANPAEIVADPAGLRRRLQQVSPEAIGLSRGRWNNVRSLFGKALALARPMLAGRSVQPLLPPWESVSAELPFNRRVGILPLLRFLSARNIGPAETTLADLESYHQAIVADRLRNKPEQTWDGLTWRWNATRREVEGWPDVEIPREIRREVYVLPWLDFPDSLKADVDAFLLRLSGADLSEDGPLTPARPTTLKTREYQLRVAASALVHRGRDAKSLATIAYMLSFENYQEILRFLLDRHNNKSSPQVAQIAGFLKDVARHWLKVDEATLDRFKKIASRLAMKRREMTAKNRERLGPFDDPIAVAAFLGLPQRLRRHVEADKRAPKLKAIRAQMAAAIAILQATPIRSKNLCELDIQKQLIARGKRLYLVIDGSAMKNGDPIEFELPFETVEIVGWYVRNYRPLLIREPTDALFPGESAKSKSASALAGQVKDTVFKFTGLKVNLHLFRHAGGKIFLDARPGQYEVLRRVLGHRSIATTTNFYTGAETRSAGKHFAEVIAERRNSLGPQKSESLISPRDGPKRVEPHGARS
jgi:integrase